MDMSKATARPWRWDELQLIGADGEFVIDSAPYEGQWFDGDNAEANKSLIVRAVNSHEALVAALRDLLDGSEPWDVRATQARAALALAEQGGG